MSPAKPGQEGQAMVKNKKPVYIVLVILAAVAIYVWMAEKQAYTAEAAEKEPAQEPVQIEASVVAGQEIAPVQPEPQIDEITPEEIAEEEYWDSLELLAICVEAEAGNQSLEGKRLVVDVILNRVDDRSGTWSDDIAGVISQKNQFTSYWDGRMDKVWEPSEETYEAVRMELEERSHPGVYYFREGAWSDYGTRWKKIGDHYFSGK